MGDSRFVVEEVAKNLGRRKMIGPYSDGRNKGFILRSKAGQQVNVELKRG